jgi:hypothetical protein
MRLVVVRASLRTFKERVFQRGDCDFLAHPRDSEQQSNAKTDCELCLYRCLTIH